MSVTCRSLLGLLAALSVSLSAWGAEPRANVLLIVSDDQGYQDLGCFGATDVRTPHLDRLAAEGIRLTDFHVAWPACTPSRGSLLTGRYPQRHGIYDMMRNDLVDVGHQYTAAEYAVSPEMILGMDEREVLLSEVLAEAGYTNGCFGKWDLGQLRRYLPLQQGFHDFYGFANTGIDYFAHERYGIPSMRRGNEITTEHQGTYATELFRRQAVQFLEQHHAEPFFLYVAFNAPHNASNLDPQVRGIVQAPEEYLQLYPAGSTVKEQRRRSYMAAVTCMDDAIGDLLDLLDQYGIAENTLVIFLSDNGGGGAADNGPLRGRKTWLFEGGVRVPCIIRWPAQLRAGVQSSRFLTALEVFPTVLAATGTQPPEGVVLDGFDMLPALKGETKGQRYEMFWQRREDRAARRGKWKWVDSQRGSGLFDLVTDVGEQRNLAEKHPEIVKGMQQRFAAWEQAMQAAEPRGPFRDY